MYKKELVLVLFLLIAFASFASAEIVFSQANPVYNVDDEFNMTIRLYSQAHASGFLTAKLICGSDEIEIYRAPYTLLPNENKEVQISTKLGNFLVSTGGECFVKAAFNNEEKDSQRFEITRALDISFDIDKALALPGEKISAVGKAEKADGRALAGFVEVQVQAVNFSYASQITDGNFNFTFTLPSNIRSGVYEIKARVYEKDSFGSIVNEGNSATTMRIKQIPKKIQIAFDSESLSAKSELKYSPLVLDQAGEKIDADVSLAIYSPGEKEFKKQIIRSGESGVFFIESNFSPGEWRAEAKFENIVGERKFLVEEFRELSYVLENDALTVKNTGNVPYTGPIRITIDDVTEIKEIENLNVGETKKYRLIAPKGEHTVFAGSGNSLNDLGKTFFTEGTGKAIAVRDFSDAFNYSNLLILVWLVIIAAVAIAAVYFYRKVRKKSYLGTEPKGAATSRFKALPTVQQKEANTKTMIDKGEKQESAIVSLKIGNINSLYGTPATGAIDSVLFKAKETGAKVYSDGEYRIVVFAPSLTQEKDNSLKAINFAQEAEKHLSVHNKRFASKIDFGIGVNVGELIVENQDGKFKFMSVNNLIGSTKRISEEANSEVLMPESLRRKLVSKVKSTKLHDKNLYRIEKVTDRSAHTDFINKFRQRNK